MPRQITTTRLRKAFHATDRLGRRLWTMAKLAQKAGISESQVSKILKGQSPQRRDSRCRRAVIEALGLR